MPTYDYVCEKCGREFEVFQSMKDPRLTDCLDETCDGNMRRKIGTGAGLVFKGSGFYITDYRSEGYKAAAKKDSAGGGSSSGGDGGGSSSSSSGGGESKSAPSASTPSSSPAPKKAD